MNIRTAYWRKPGRMDCPPHAHPFPFDWEAWVDDWYDDEDAPIGFGPTQEAAIKDLKARIEEDEQ